MMTEYAEAKITPRILLGPGPSGVDARVLKALSSTLLGHLDPEFLAIMNQIQDMLRQVFQTSNTVTIPISGTGSAGMEAALLNFIEAGDSVLVCEAGVFGQRMTEIARRAGGRVTVVKSPWGKPIDGEDLARAADSCQPRLISIVHAETSTGVLQPWKRPWRLPGSIRPYWWSIPLPRSAGIPFRSTRPVSMSATAALKNASAARRVGKILGLGPDLSPHGAYFHELRPS
jgi:hypothetical protein